LDGAAEPRRLPTQRNGIRGGGASLRYSPAVAAAWDVLSFDDGVPPNFLAGSRNVIKGGGGRRRRPWLGPPAAADQDAFYFDEVTERHRIKDVRADGLDARLGWTS